MVHLKLPKEMSLLNNVFAALGLFSITGLLSNQAYGNPSTPILEHYPQCEYQIIETHTESRKLTQQDGRLAQEYVDQAFALIVTKLKQRAGEVGAQGIILIDRDLALIEKQNWTKSRDKHSLVSYTAELINHCEPDVNLEKKSAPFNAQGQPQKQLQLGAIGGWQQEIEIALPSQNKRITPDLRTTNIGSVSGFYGVPLGTDYQTVVDTFGTPTFVMAIDSRHRLIAYGRKHWLVFQHNKFVQVTSEIPWLSTELTNLLAFDDRFEQQEWSLQGKVQYRESASKVRLNLDVSRAYDNKMVIEKDATTLTVLLDQYLDPDSKDQRSMVVGFDFRSKGFELPSLPNIDHGPEVLNRIATYFTNPDREELTMAMLGVSPLASAYKDSTSQLLVFGPHLIVEQSGVSLSKVILLEQVFEQNNTTASDGWQFNGLHQGQTLDSALEVLGDNAFHFGDVVEYSADAYTQYLYFYEQDDKVRLYGSEISIY